MKNDPYRLRNLREARHYVAGIVSALLEAEVMNGSAWLHMHSGAEQGNLKDLRSENRALIALRELIAIIDNFEDANAPEKTK